MLAYDEAFYLSKYPDVAEAVRRGDWPSGLVHYAIVGQSNGRIAGPEVDESWYVNAYPLVKEEIASGKINSALRA